MKFTYLTFDNKPIELSIEDTKRLYNELRSLFEEKESPHAPICPIVVQPIYPNPPNIYPYPGPTTLPDDMKYPYVTWRPTTTVTTMPSTTMTFTSNGANNTPWTSAFARDWNSPEDNEAWRDL